MTLLRGRKGGLEITLAGLELGAALEALEARLTEQPGFYRGIAAVANFGSTLPSAEELERLNELLCDAGIELRALSGSGDVEALARELGYAFESLPLGHELARRRAARPSPDLSLSDAARSLIADFAGARADIADRRRRGEASVRRASLPPGATPSVQVEHPPLHVVEAPPGTLYQAGTVRGGQALHHVGNIVVVGDVNPGAELIASGDILVFGRLAGVAHAGAQGDDRARVYALDLDATQLRIATCIAAGERAHTQPARPEVALVRDARIAIVPYDRLDAVERGVAGL